jgi:hypothetical protein
MTRLSIHLLGQLQVLVDDDHAATGFESNKVWPCSHTWPWKSVSPIIASISSSLSLFIGGKGYENHN